MPFFLQLFLFSGLRLFFASVLSGGRTKFFLPIFFPSQQTRLLPSVCTKGGGG